MKFPRNSKLLRSPFDAAPFAAVFFLLVIFLLLGALLPTPGLPLQLPPADNLPGTDQPTVAVAVDQNERYFFGNQMMPFETLSNRLQSATSASRVPLTLVINADRAVTYDTLVQISLLAREVGITNVLLATLPASTGKRIQLP
jgi:biopolymer transport protein ExbD